MLPFSLAVAGALATPIAKACFNLSRDPVDPITGRSCWCQCTWAGWSNGVYCNRDTLPDDDECFQCAEGPCAEFPDY